MYLLSHFNQVEQKKIDFKKNEINEQRYYHVD